MMIKKLYLRLAVFSLAAFAILAINPSAKAQCASAQGYRNYTPSYRQTTNYVPSHRSNHYVAPSYGYNNSYAPSYGYNRSYSGGSSYYGATYSRRERLGRILALAAVTGAVIAASDNDNNRNRSRDQDPNRNRNQDRNRNRRD